MRSIVGALSKVLDPGHPSPGDDLDLAANQARELVTTMSAIGLRVRNVMRELTAQVTTAEAMRKIFEDYIGKLYMTDYAELAGSDHPLARKSHVLELARDMAFTDQRDRLTKIGRANVWTPVTNAHPVFRLLLEKNKKHT